MKYDMREYEKWCNTPGPGGAIRRDSAPRRIVYKLGFSAGRNSCQEILDSLRSDVAALRAESRACWEHIVEGRMLMNRLASAADGAALSGDLIPDELSDEFLRWVHATPWMPRIGEAIPPGTGDDQGTCTQDVQVGVGTAAP